MIYKAFNNNVKHLAFQLQESHKHQWLHQDRTSLRYFHSSNLFSKHLNLGHEHFVHYYMQSLNNSITYNFYLSLFDNGET